MAYALSFAEEFFWGDPGIPPETLTPSNRPTSVYQALVSLNEHEWATLARDVFNVEPEHLDISTVLSRIKETNTCSNLDIPVEVHIDAESWYRVLVYDRKEASRVPCSSPSELPSASEATPLHD